MERPLKIGMVSAFDYAFHGGVTSHIQELAIQMESWGHSVTVVAPCSNPGQVTSDNFIPMGRPVPVPSRGSIARISVSVWLHSRIKSLLAEEAFEIVHFHEPFSGFLSLAILKESRAVNIATFHSFPGSRLLEFGGTKLAMPYFRKLHGLIAVSQPAREAYNSRFPGDYHVIPNGIRVEKFADGAGPLSEYQDGMINLLFLGRLEKRKGLKHMLAAYSRLKWDWPNLRLLVVGPGKPDEDSYRIMSERNLQDVVFVGEVSDEDRVRYYQTADIYCSPATGGESFGVVLLEAMAAGKPIVATSIEGYSSVITNGEEGLLVPPKDDQALADAIAALLQDPVLRGKLADNGLRRVDEFRWEKVAQRVLDHYLACLDSVAVGSA